MAKVVKNKLLQLHFLEVNSLQLQLHYRHFSKYNRKWQSDVTLPKKNLRHIPSESVK